MRFNKITEGFVIQTFEDDKCVFQEFIAGHDCQYETPEGQPLPLDGNEFFEDAYHPFNMEQPEQNEIPSE